MKPNTPRPAAPDASGLPTDQAGPTAPSVVEPVAKDLGQPESRSVRFFAYRRLWLLAALVFTFDQLTKYWLNARLPLGSYGLSGITIIPGFFSLVHVGNTGAAWSMFTGKSTLLGLLAGATLLAIFYWRRQLGLRLPAAQSAFGLLCGGIVGNLVDRLLHGHVIDFIDLHFGNYTYPTFNVADSGICVGVIWYVLWSLRNPTPGASAR